MTGKYRISRAARADLDQIWDYISANDAKAATQFIGRITDKFLMLANQPLIGEARSELARNVRDFPVGNYVIYYRTVESESVTVEIVRILHGARDVKRAF
jgi:toxin ParE1/3/4